MHDRRPQYYETLGPLHRMYNNEAKYESVSVVAHAYSRTKYPHLLLEIALFGISF